MKTTRRHLVAGTSALAVATATGIRATTVAAQDVTTINWWHITTNEEEAAHMQKAADDYMAANPDVKIEITVQENEAFKTRLTTVMQSGEPPDIFQSWGGGVLQQYAEAGLVRDITADLAEDGWGESFGQAGLGLYAADGDGAGRRQQSRVLAAWHLQERLEAREIGPARREAYHRDAIIAGDMSRHDIVR